MFYRLITTLIMCITLLYANAEQRYKGTLMVSPLSRLELFLTIADDGSATLLSPSQSDIEIPLEVKLLTKDSVAVTQDKLGMKYNGHFVGSSIHGQFEQNGMRRPLNFSKTKPKTYDRPQTPQPTDAYSCSEVFITTEDGATLAGTLTTPANADENTPVIIMITGSGAQNRDEEIFGHRPFAVLADTLARCGIASLRCDDRGFAKSTGDITIATTATFIKDAEAQIEWLRANGNKFGLIGALGHSEGGRIAFALAAKNSVDFIISIAGPAMRGDEILIRQNADLLAASGIEDEQISIYTNALSNIFNNKPYSSAGLSPKLAENLPAVEKSVQNPWLAYFLADDPTDDIASIKIPSLAVYASLDLQVAAVPNAERIRSINPNIEVALLDKLNHLMQPAKTGGIDEYSKIKITLDNSLLSTVINFLRDNIPFD